RHPRRPRGASEMAVTQMVGARIPRREDPKLVTGHGSYIDDLTLTGLCHLAFVRSPYAHARIRSIDAGRARSAPGVIGVYAAADFDGVLGGAMPVTASFIAEKKQTPPQPYI